MSWLGEENRLSDQCNIILINETIDVDGRSVTVKRTGQ